MGQRNRSGNRAVIRRQINLFDGAVRGVTLIEVVIALVLVVIAAGLASVGSNFLIGQVDGAVERQNMHTQIDLAFEDMRLRCMSAAQSYTSFSTGGSTTDKLRFSGESDIYTITPDDLGDNAIFQYYVNVAGDLVLRTETAAGALLNEAVLVERKFAPVIQFTYTPGDEPDFITIDVTAQTQKVMMGGAQTVHKTDSIRFWFIDVVA